MTQLEWALRYAVKGWPVFPCGKDKHPMVKDWPNVATTDQGQIQAWWDKWPDASIGVPTGLKIGAWVLDVDGEHGARSLLELQEKHGDIPATTAQQTGSGGRHFFWLWNGREIRNSASKLGPGLDVRGEGGFVILPESGHPSGGHYSWLTDKRTPMVHAPEWLANLACGEKPEPGVTGGKPEARHPSASGAKPERRETTNYGEAALLGIAAELSKAVEGERNEVLNLCAFRAGQLVGGGEIDYAQAHAMLYGSALSIGLTEREIGKTLGSGMKKGMENPRRREDTSVPELSDKTDSSDKTDKTDISDSSDRIGQNRTKSDSFRTNRTASGQRFDGNMTAEMRKWVESSTGSFTVADVDREFGLTDRRDRKTRTDILSLFIKEGILTRDRSVKGKYHCVDRSVEWIDLDAVQEDNFALELPLDLSEMVSIPPKSIVVLAGASNSGKTAFMLNVAGLNLADVSTLYLMSEMGGSEYKQRLRLFDMPMDFWKPMKAAVRSSGFQTVVQNHNRDGLTLVDFLEEVDGEYFKINSSIRDIYDALGDGVAFIALQKKAGALYGRGGEATQEKARLYLAMDNLVHTPGCTICALRIVKAKCYPEGARNPNGLERHFKVIRGHKLESLTEWRYFNEGQRKQAVAHYQRFHGGDNNGGPF